MLYIQRVLNGGSRGFGVSRLGLSCWSSCVRLPFLRPTTSCFPFGLQHTSSNNDNTIAALSIVWKCNALKLITIFQHTLYGLWPTEIIYLINLLVWFIIITNVYKQIRIENTVARIAPQAKQLVYKVKYLHKCERKGAYSRARQSGEPRRAELRASGCWRAARPAPRAAQAESPGSTRSTPARFRRPATCSRLSHHWCVLYEYESKINFWRWSKLKPVRVSEGCLQGSCSVPNRRVRVYGYYSYARVVLRLLQVGRAQASLHSTAPFRRSPGARPARRCLQRGHRSQHPHRRHVPSLRPRENMRT